jgi:hypothetical protein
LTVPKRSGAKLIFNYFFIMRKLSLNELNLGVESLLQRGQLKTILGGYIQECRLAIRNADGSFGYWTDAAYSVSDAQDAYNSHQTFSDGSYVSGYCCASC